ncbi:MAG: hypothetical protein AAF441_21355, partial [Pseudomonadota bacterium]
SDYGEQEGNYNFHDITRNTRFFPKQTSNLHAHERAEVLTRIESSARADLMFVWERNEYCE